MKTQRTLPKLTLMQSICLLLLAGRIEKEVDPTLADLIRKCAGGNDTAVDRLIEIGRPDDAARLKRILGG